MSLEEQLDELIRLATRKHYWCDDSYYSCPADSEGCSNPAYEDTKECQCGADEHNAKVAILAAEIKARIKPKMSIREIAERAGIDITDIQGEDIDVLTGKRMHND